MSRQFKLYSAMAGDSTVRREYLRALVLAVSGTENLLPASQVVADRVIATVAEFFLLHRRPAAGCHFAVDLLASRPPYRVGDGVAPARTVRFFGPGDAAMMVERLIQRTTETGRVPPELNLVGEFHASMVLEVLQHLSRHWGANPPSRSELRQRVLSTLNVAHGFDDVWRAVSAEQDQLRAGRDHRGLDGGGREQRRLRRGASGARRRLAERGYVDRRQADLARVVERGRDPAAVNG